MTFTERAGAAPGNDHGSRQTAEQPGQRYSMTGIKRAGARLVNLVALAEAILQVVAAKPPCVQSAEVVGPLPEIDEGQEEQQATEQAEDLVLEPGQQHLIELGLSGPFQPSYLFTRTGLTASVLPGWDNLSSRCTP